MCVCVCVCVCVCTDLSVPVSIVLSETLSRALLLLCSLQQLLVQRHTLLLQLPQLLLGSEVRGQRSTVITRLESESGTIYIYLWVLVIVIVMCVCVCVCKCVYT